MKIKLFISIFCLAAFHSFAQSNVEEYAVIPHPQEISYIQGTLELSSKPVIAYPDRLSNEASLLAS